MNRASQRWAKRKSYLSADKLITRQLYMLIVIFYYNSQINQIIILSPKKQTWDVNVKKFHTPVSCI